MSATDLGSQFVLAGNSQSPLKIFEPLCASCQGRVTLKCHSESLSSAAILKACMINTNSVGLLNLKVLPSVFMIHCKQRLAQELLRSFEYLAFYLMLAPSLFWLLDEAEYNGSACKKHTTSSSEKRESTQKAPSQKRLSEKQDGICQRRGFLVVCKKVAGKPSNLKDLLLGRSLGHSPKSLFSRGKSPKGHNPDGNSWFRLEEYQFALTSLTTFLLQAESR